MIQAIKELGEQKLKREGKKLNDIIDIIAENPNKDNNYPKILTMVFEKDKDKFKYKEIKIDETDSKKFEKYLYYRGASSGPDYSLTSKITEVKKFFKNKVEGWFKKYKKHNNPFINNLIEAFEKSKNKILNELIKKSNDVKDKNKGILFTLAIQEGNKLKYIGDFPVFRDLLLNEVKNKLQNISKKNHICSICGENKEEIYGEAIPFKFYTLDKPGYIAGGFQEKEAWKNAPVCFDCFLKLIAGKNFLDEHLKRKMAGITYYLIPKFILGTEKVKDEIKKFFYYAENSDVIIKAKILERITEDEKEILEILSELKDVLIYNFLFFTSDNPQVFKIDLLIEDILPSRLSALFKTKKEVEKYEIFKNVKIKKNEYSDVKFTFEVLKEFIPERKTFLEIIDKIFRGINIERNILFSLFMGKIRKAFINEVPLKVLLLKAFLSLLFIKKLNILPQKIFETGGKIMVELKEKAENFFNTFTDTFNKIHKPIFLLGVLTQKLLNIQYSERNATPFRKKLKSLKMKEEDFKALLPEIQNKLEEYNKNYYQKLETLISAYFLEAGKNWKISTDELNFYFVLGMNLSDEVSKILEL